MDIEKKFFENVKKKKIIYHDETIFQTVNKMFCLTENIYLCL